MKTEEIRKILAHGTNMNNARRASAKGRYLLDK